MSNKLTERELEILKLITLELSTREIAQRLLISASTVESHKKSLYIKLGVKTAAGMTRKAFEHGILKTPLKK